MIKITHLSLSWADGDRGSVLWSSGQWHVRRGEGQVHSFQGPKKLNAAGVCPESFADHGERAVVFCQSIVCCKELWEQPLGPPLSFSSDLWLIKLMTASMITVGLSLQLRQIFCRCFGNGQKCRLKPLQSKVKIFKVWPFPKSDYVVQWLAVALNRACGNCVCYISCERRAHYWAKYWNKIDVESWRCTNTSKLMTDFTTKTAPTSYWWKLMEGNKSAPAPCSLLALCTWT